jgi:hypothetical protein
MRRIIRNLAAVTTLAIPVLAVAEDWKYVKSISIPRPYAPIFAATTPNGDCVVTTFNNTPTAGSVDLPVIMVHDPLSENPGFYVVCKNPFAAFRGYSGVAVDSDSNYYVAADTGDNQSWIRKFLPNGKADPTFGTNGEVKPGFRVLGLDLTGKYLFTTFGFATLAQYDARTGQLLGTVAPPAGTPPNIRDIAVDPTREIIYGVAEGAVWIWKGGTFSNLSGYKIEQISEKAIKAPKAGEGIFFDAFVQRAIVPVSELSTLFSVDDKGHVSKSGIAGAGAGVRSPADAVLLADGQTLFISDMIAGDSKECSIHVMKRTAAQEEPAEESGGLPSLAAAGLIGKPGQAKAAATAPIAGGKVSWRRNFDEAFDEAKQSNKPVLLYARTSLANRCTGLENGFLQSDKFVVASKSCVPFYFDLATDSKLAQQLGIFRVPYFATFKPGGDRVGMWHGAVDTAELLKGIEDAAK